MERLFEDNRTEFKENLDSPDFQSWFKTCCAFANCGGGTLYIGLNNRGESVGVDNDKLDSIFLKFDSCVREHSYPIIAYKKVVLPLKNQINKSIIKYEIISNTNSITWLIKNNHNPIMYVRSDGQTIQANLEEMQRALISTTFNSFDETSIGILHDDVSFSELSDLYKTQNNGDSLTENLMKSFNLIDNNGFLTMTGYLFSDNSSYSNANIVCTTWPSISKGSNDYVNSRLFCGSAISLFNKTIDYITNVSFYSFGGLKTGIFRNDIGSFSLISLREAIINAIAHRDYTILGGQISVDCFPDRIEISSPGSFIQKDQEISNAKLEAFPSLRRNKNICNVFCKCHLMEEKGSGFAEIAEDYRGLSDIYFPLYSSTKMSFTIVLKNKKYKLFESASQTVDSDYHFEVLRSTSFKTKEEIFSQNPRYQDFYNLIIENKYISYDELAYTFNMTRDGAKFYIKQLKEACLIRRIGSKVSGNYEIVNDIDRPERYLQLEDDVKDKVLEWCKHNFVKMEKFNLKHSSYGLKHMLQKKTGIYLSNGAFKGVMLILGFRVKDIQNLNWLFNVSEKSPAIDGYYETK